MTKSILFEKFSIKSIHVRGVSNYRRLSIPFRHQCADIWNRLYFCPSFTLSHSFASATYFFLKSHLLKSTSRFLCPPLQRCGIYYLHETRLPLGIRRRMSRSSSSLWSIGYGFRRKYQCLRIAVVIVVLIFTVCSFEHGCNKP